MIKKFNDWYLGLSPLRRFVVNALFIVNVLFVLRFVIRFVDATFITTLL